MSADKSLAPGGAQCETIFIGVEWQHPFHCGNLGFNLNELLFRLIIVSMSATPERSTTFIIQIRQR